MPQADIITKYYIDIFTLLSNTRTEGSNGPNPIQISEIFKCYEIFGGIDNIKDHIEILLYMDQIYLEFQSNKTKQEIERINKQHKLKRK